VICETVAKPVTRSNRTLFLILLEKSFENFFGRRFWAIERFHHLEAPALAKQ